MSEAVIPKAKSKAVRLDKKHFNVMSNRDINKCH